MKKVLSFLMVCVFSVVFTGALIGCQENGESDGVKAKPKTTEVQKEETQMQDDQ